MSDAIFAQFAGGMRTLNTALTAAFAPDGTVCYLLRKEGETNTLSVVKQLEDGFFIEFNEFRGDFTFTYADADPSFRDAFARSTHIGYGVPDADGDIEVFEFSKTLGVDIVDPNGTSPFWKAGVSKVESERFTIPSDGGDDDDDGSGD